MAAPAQFNWLDGIMPPHNPSKIPASWYEQMWSKWDKQVPYLAKDYDAEHVKRCANQQTLWVDQQGSKFEVIQNANINGCLPGNFKTIDSVETTNTGKKVGVSLKSMFLENRHPVWTQGAQNLLLGYLKELREFAGDSRNLKKVDGSGTAKTSVWISELDYLLLRIGVPLSVFNAHTQAFTNLAKEYTAPDLGGLDKSQYNLMDVRKNNRVVPVQLEFTGAPDNIFNPGYGELYEDIKMAEIDNESPGTFKTIDKWKPNKERVVSYKAHDLVRNYTGDQGVVSFAKTLKGEIDVLSEFAGYTETGGWHRSITTDDYNQKRLSIAIPAATDLKRFHEVFERAFYYGAERGVMLRVHRVS